MKLKLIKQKFCNLEIAEKIKIRRRFITLKDDIKAKPLKYAIPIFSLIILGSPRYSYAEGIIRTDQGTCPNPEGPKSTLNKYRELGISLIGLKKCLDPRATPLQKALYCSRPCCIVAGLTAGCVAETTPAGSKIHDLASICCASSWMTYTILLKCDREKTIIPKK